MSLEDEMMFIYNEVREKDFKKNLINKLQKC